jgi:hypothetical protein
MSVKYLIVGHSHIEALRRAWDAVHDNEENKKTKMRFLNIRHDEYRISDKQGNKISPLSPENAKYKKILSDFRAMSSGCRAVVFLLSSNEHNSIGTFVASEDSDEQIAELIKDTFLGRQRKWFELFAPCSSEMQVYVLMAPPPGRV